MKSLLSGLTKEDVEGLFQRLTSGSTKDDFAVFFNSDGNAPAEVREELLAILRSRMGDAGAATAPGVAGKAKPSTVTEEPVPAEARQVQIPGVERTQTLELKPPALAKAPFRFQLRSASIFTSPRPCGCIAS